MISELSDTLYYFCIGNSVYCCTAIRIDKEFPSSNNTNQFGSSVVSVTEDYVTYTIICDIIGDPPLYTNPHQTIECMLLFDDTVMILRADYLTTSEKIHTSMNTEIGYTTTNYSLTLHDPQVTELPV